MSPRFRWAPWAPSACWADGWLADKLSAKRRNGRLLLSACSMAIAAPCLFFAVNQPKGAIAAFMLLMAIGTMTMFVYYATVYAAIQDVIEPRLRGTAVAIYFCAMYVLGASFGPLGLGMLSDHFAHRAMRDAGAARHDRGLQGVRPARRHVRHSGARSAGILGAVRGVAHRRGRHPQAASALEDRAADHTSISLKRAR